MKRYIIDTNALISFITDRNIDQQKRISSLFEESSRLKAVLLCPQNVITEFVYVLDNIYNVPKTKINSMIYDIMITPGIEIIHELPLESLLGLWPSKISDFGDAVVASLGFQFRGSIIATFDISLRTILNKMKLATISL